MYVGVGSAGVGDELTVRRGREAARMALSSLARAVRWMAAPRFEMRRYF